MPKQPKNLSSDSQGLNKLIIVVVNVQNRANILIPCHRGIVADGSLTGYGSGLHRKKGLF